MGRLEKIARTALVGVALATAGCAAPKVPTIGSESTPTPTPLTAATAPAGENVFMTCTAVGGMTVDGKSYLARRGVVVEVDFTASPTSAQHAVTADKSADLDCERSGPNPTSDQVDATKQKAITRTEQLAGLPSTSPIRQFTING